MLLGLVVSYNTIQLYSSPDLNISMTLFHSRLSLVTGGEIASTFDRPDLVKLGHCDLIEEILIGEDRVCAMIRFGFNSELLFHSYSC
jgi:hypothetical protein